MIQVKSPVILAYRMSEEEYRSLEQLIAPMGIRTVRVENGQEKAPVGFLAGASGWRPGFLPPAPGLTEKMLVLAGLDDRKLDFVLKLLRQGPGRGVLKAVLTETNAAWSGCVLQQELKREREAMG